MPVSYQFIHKKTGVAAQLADVDAAIRKTFGLPADEEEFNPWYEFLVELGVSLLMVYGGFRVTKNMIDKRFEETVKRCPEFQLEPKVYDMVVYWLDGEYVFDAAR
jgi:hypothetical protein